MGIEYEQKFDATPALLRAIAEAFPEEGQIFQMETTYYDTPSGALSARHYTLRRRLENGISVCTLKTPAGDARAEWELNCNTIEEAIAQLPKLGCPADFVVLVQEGLTCVCGARFTRIAKTITAAEGTLELALDEGVLMGGGRELPLCEVEVELKDGTPAFCEVFAKMLAHRFGLKGQPFSKFRRALALYRGE